MSETEILSKFKITKTTNSRLKEFDQTNIQFGKIFADHIGTESGQTWKSSHMAH